MPDRRRRAALLRPTPATAGWGFQPATAPGAVLLPRERKSSSSPDSPTPDSPSSGRPDPAGTSAPKGSPAPNRDNPFAPPPAGAPDQEWRPRTPAGHGQDRGGDGNGNGDGDGGQERQDGPPAWGSQWSSRQPGRQSGEFGSRPGRGGPQGGGQGGPGTPGGLRWDPTDPVQRRARYALLAGMWSFFFVLFSLPEVALLLGSLSLYWGISALRGKPDPAKTRAAAATAAIEGRPAPAGPPPSPGATRPQTTAAIAGLVTASLALMMVAATFTVQIVYRDYFSCVNDALTQSASKSCENLLPPQLRPLLSQQQP
ncbi:hypothetical protein [Streptomyces sp. CT34]|uniref:hypothetical protein n=1 Tax=Streptomyces sp. CT34 TaxID=1553907 RepID=UPI0005BCEA2B|nr:hypothetical protein [Streptomyces sp. CT34]